MVHLLRFMRGQVRFTVQGGFAQRLLNLCTRAQLSLWEIVPTPFGFTACANASDYRAICRLAKRVGAKVRIAEKSGLRFWIFQNRKRWGMFLGGAGFAALLCTMSLFVWTIRFEGLAGMEETVLRYQLAQLGVREGVRHSTIDADYVERSMMVQNDALSWIAVNVQGSTVTVKLKERTVPMESAHSVEHPANIVALHGGIVREVQTYTGQEVVQIGDTVAAGDLLISGVVEFQNGKSAVRRATGRVVIEHDAALEAAVPLREKVLVPTEEVIQQCALEVLGKRIPLSLQGPPKEPSRPYAAQKRLTVFGVQLPVTLHLTAYQLLEEQLLCRSEEEARQQAEEELQLLEELQLQNAEVLERTVTGRLEDGVFILSGRYLVQEDAGVQREFSVGS